MTSVATTSIDKIAELIGKALAPLLGPLDGGGDPELERFVASLGWTLPSVPPSLRNLAVDVGALSGTLRGLDTARRALDAGTGSEGQVLAAVAAVLAAAVQTANAIANLSAALTAELPAGFVAASQFPDEFPPRLLDALAVSAIYQAAPLVARALRVIGLIEVTPQLADATKAQPAFTLRRMRFDRLGPLLSDPAAVFRDVYGWGTPALQLDPLFDALLSLSYAIGTPGSYDYPPASLIEALAPGASSDRKRLSRSFQLTLIDLGLLRISLVITAIPTTSPGELQGIAFALYLQGGGAELVLPLTTQLDLAIEVKLDLGAGLGIALRPDQPPQFVLDFSGLANPVLSGSIGVRLTFRRVEPAKPLALLSLPGGSRIETREIAGGITLHRTSDGEIDIGFEAGLRQSRVVITLSGADGFLGKLLPPDGLVAPFELIVGWSHRRGLYFSGAGGLEVTLPLHLELGPVTLVEVILGLFISAEGLSLAAGLSATGQIGPVSAAVQNVGARALLRFVAGNLGPLDLGLRFKPPAGIGIAVEAGPVSGGGFILFDEPNGRYAGVLQLKILAISIAAIALIDTRLPDGRPGYSFLIIICVEFTPIQLGYGFTLNGVGGLAGIHRTVNTEALRTGVYTGSLDHIMFPKDPVKNAPQLISDLSRIFPPAEGQFTFGPMVKIGWGASIVELSIGIIIELPDPVRIALLGQLAAFLPQRKAAVVELHFDFVALLDFGGKLFSLDATLRDSRIAVWTLSGDIAMRLSWGDNPNFALALGGFHPHFQPPPGFPVLRRLTLALGAGDRIRINCQTYQAITSNTLQMGARADLKVNVGVYVHGWIGFDALVIFSPFSFEVDFTAGLEVGVGGVRLGGVTFEGTLSGPTPWRVRGSATLSLLFFEVSAHVDVQFGAEDVARLAAVDPWAPLLAALTDARNWSAALPPGATVVVSVRAPAGAPILIDPCGRATWRERVAPLDRTLSKFANAATPAPVKFTVDRVTIGGVGAAFNAVVDFFAAGQFEELTDQQKLSRPSFERMQGGLEVASSSVRAGPSVPAEVIYETKIIDSKVEIRRMAPYALSLPAHLALIGSSAIARGPLTRSGLEAYAAKRRLGEAEETFVVVSTDTLTPRADISKPTTKGAAHQALDAYLSGRPHERDALQVVPAHELEDA